MPKSEWGVKRICPSCAARFYDLTRDPVVCPKCEAVVDVSVLVRAKRAKPAAKAAVKKKIKVAEPLIEDDEEASVDDADDTDDVLDADTPIVLAVDDDDDDDSETKAKVDDTESLDDFDDDVQSDDDDDDDDDIVVIDADVVKDPKDI